MPKFLEDKLKKEYGAKSKTPFKVMNAIGAMRGNKETAKGRHMALKHARQHPDDKDNPMVTALKRVKKPGRRDVAGDFTDVWDSAYNATPADNENINLGAGRIRDLKNAIQQRMVIDHSWAGDDNDGKHNQATLRVQSAAPALDPTDGAIYSQAVSSNTELFYEDSSGNAIQLTSAGNINVPTTPPPFPSGTVMLFAQATAPTGWTQNTSVNDYLLRIVDDTSGGTGGGSWAITGINSSGTVGGTTLSSDQIPQHTHNTTLTLSAQNADLTGSGSNVVIASGSTVVTTDGGTGGGGSHTHSVGVTTAGDGTWRPQYINALIANKD